MQEVIGTHLNDRYRLEEKIGSGGMSTVYSAFDPTLERWVAIKLMHRDLSGDPDQLERFRREARAVARLSHPHVVTVIDFGEDDGTPYIVLEHVEGETLKERIRRMGRLPVAEAMAYAIEIGRALSAAHAQRLVHRDVKPQNVLIDGEGRAKVTDFGIARSLEAQGLTATGRVLGTTDYVSPEQALGQEVSEQSDLYSLGVVLFEMLTGEVPFKAESQVAVAMKHVKDPLPDVQRLRPEVSASLAAVVDRATAKETREPLCHGDGDGGRPRGARSRSRSRAPGSPAARPPRCCARSPATPPTWCRVRLRNPRRWVLTVVAVLLVAGGAVGYFATRTEKGAGDTAAPRGGGADRGRPGLERRAGLRPRGRRQRVRRRHQNAIDGNPSTEWDTERYTNGLDGVEQDGVGLYVDAGSPIAARRLCADHPHARVHRRDLRRQRRAGRHRGLDARSARDFKAAERETRRG